MCWKKNIKKSNSKKGHYTVEAAIFLPVFIIAILSLGYLIKVIGIEENVYHCLTDEANKLSCEAYVKKLDFIFPQQVISRAEEENKCIKDFKIKGYKYLYSNGSIEDLISFRCEYNIRVNLPMAMHENFSVENKLLFRGFTGVRSKKPPMSKQEMEEEKKSELVWIFPKNGSKYHDENCSYIKVYPKQMCLGMAKKQGYKPCALCNSKDLSGGSLVYCFSKSGRVYHNSDCSTVDKYVISIDKEEAIEKGYTACQKCGGGN